MSMLYSWPEAALWTGMVDRSFDETVDAFHRGATAVAKAARKAEARNGLGPSQLAVLGYLQREGPLPIAALAARENVSHPTMSRLVSGLERAGLVAKALSATDARARMVAITELGDRRRGDAVFVRRELVEALAGRLTPTALAELVDALEAVAAQISDGDSRQSSIAR
ncbi:MAG: MarR family transcriptional regulator [Alphaproteobacteria bacterium]|nr:MarR family transcriptional regulator [Alphaproteobacteria bacterium]